MELTEKSQILIQNDPKVFNGEFILYQLAVFFLSLGLKTQTYVQRKTEVKYFK